MAIGPFTTYAPPGVYTQTLIEPIVGNVLAGLRVPVLIGVGQETLTQNNIELVRGSSSAADTPLFGEDPSGRWLVGGTNALPILGNQDGSRFSFRVRNYPIVDGEGAGRVTFDPSRVSVTVNGEAAVVGQVDGTNGIITLLSPPNANDVVIANYFFRRKDTQITDDLSDQVTDTLGVLVSPKTETFDVIAGTNDEFEFFVNDSPNPSLVILTPGTRSAADIANDINTAGFSGLTASITVDNQGLNRVQLVAQGNIRIGTGNANGVLGFNPGDNTGRNRAFRVFNGPVVDGSDGGITTNDVTKVTVLVNNVRVIPESLDGLNRLVTLPTAPSPNSTVTVQYFFNTWQDTFDFLPNGNVVSVSNVGISPGRRDFLNGPDFIVQNEEGQSRIVWGSSFQVASANVEGNVPLDGTQVVGQLVDNRVYASPTTRFVDPNTNRVSTTRFVLELRATTGNGRDTPLSTDRYRSISNGRLDLSTTNPNLITAYAGKGIRDALSRPPVKVLEVDSVQNIITLAEPVSADFEVFATFWYNILTDDVYTLTVQSAGPSGVGQYTVTSQTNNNASLFNIRYGGKNALPQTINWPSGVENFPDAFHFGGNPIPETVTVTFDQSLLPATHASFSNQSPEPYDIFDFTRIFGGVSIDGNSPISVNLAVAFPAILLSQPIENPTSLTFESSDRLALEVDGIILASIDLSSAANITDVVTAINAAIDADTQVHADGTGTFASTAPNALASAVTYGTESILKIESRSTPSKTNGLVSSVRVLTPVGIGETDASDKLSLLINQEAEGSYDGLNQAARLSNSRTGPFNITAAVTDLLNFGIDGLDYAVTFPAGTTIETSTIVSYINSAYLANASSGEQASALAALIALINELKADYNAHISNTGGSFHSIADGVNIVTAVDASDLPTLIALATDFKTNYNNHISNTGGVFHPVADTVNGITADIPADLQTAIIFLEEAKRLYNAHLSQATVHVSDDAVNITSAGLPEPISRLGQGIENGFFIIESPTNTVNSSVSIGSTSTADEILGLISGDFQRRNQPDSNRIANALNADSGFNALAVSYKVQAQGLGGFLRIDSLTSGSGSTISFTNTTNTSFVDGTGLGIVPGTSGDFGEAAQSGFRVSSSAGSNGSSGTGVPGQTYTDARTGLRFSVLPPEAGDYANGGSFTLSVNSTFTADAAIPTLAIPGLFTTVFNTNNMIPGTSAALTTYNKDGAEPAVGDTYFISYNFLKNDLGTGLFRDLKNITANFGPPTPEFPLSLAARLALLNGAVVVGLKQVLRAPGQAQAPIGEYLDAIQEQRKPIEGSIKQDTITPLANDPTIFTTLNQHCVFMSSPRQQGERTAIVGPAAGTTPSGVQTIALGLQSELTSVVYPDSYIVSVQDNQGNVFDQLVDSSFMAAAIAGSTANPSVDVATPWTRRQIVGFKNLGRILDPTEANQVAVAGVNVIENVSGIIRIRHGLTTRLDNVITRTPSVTLTIQFVQQAVRRTLDPYIGQKFTGTLLKTVENSLAGLFSNLIDGQIISVIAGISVAVDEDDPTILRTEAIYVPVFPLEYIVSTLNVRIQA